MARVKDILLLAVARHSCTISARRSWPRRGYCPLLSMALARASSSSPTSFVCHAKAHGLKLAAKCSATETKLSGIRTVETFGKLCLKRVDTNIGERPLREFGMRRFDMREEFRGH